MGTRRDRPVVALGVQSPERRSGLILQLLGGRRALSQDLLYPRRLGTHRSPGATSAPSGSIPSVLRLLHACRGSSANFHFGVFPTFAGIRRWLDPNRDVFRARPIGGPTDHRNRRHKPQRADLPGSAPGVRRDHGFVSQERVVGAGAVSGADPQALNWCHNATRGRSMLSTQLRGPASRNSKRAWVIGTLKPRSFASRRK